MVEEYSVRVWSSWVGQNSRKVGAGGYGHFKGNMTTSKYMPNAWSARSNPHSVARKMFWRNYGTKHIVFPPLVEQKKNEKVFSYEFQKMTYWPNDIQSLVKRAMSENYNCTITRFNETLPIAKGIIANIEKNSLEGYNLLPTPSQLTMLQNFPTNSTLRFS